MFERAACFPWLMVTILIALSGPRPVVADQLLIPMNLDQTDHLKAYGVAYWALQKSIDVDWLLNFRGGSFLMDYTESVAGESRLRDVSFARISDAQAARIYAQMEEGNMDRVRLEKAPRIAVYTPPNAQPHPGCIL